MPARFLKNVIDLAAELELVRRIWRRPMTILSGYRSKSYNTKIGGAEKSLHLSARAADIVIAGVTPKELAAAVEKGITAGDFRFGGVGLYKNFVHLDIRYGHARWEG